MVRSDARGYALLEKLLLLFEDMEVGRFAARSLEVVGREDGDVLSKSSYSNIKVCLSAKIEMHC